MTNLLKGLFYIQTSDGKKITKEQILDKLKKPKSIILTVALLIAFIH
ncbi:MAG TPA: hypothetical protein VIK72_19465 [Clostridiaceae bacterium]